MESPVDWENELDWEERKSGSLIQHMIAGSAAGVAEHVVMFPVDTYKTHLQFARGKASVSFLDLARQGGVLRLWRGVFPVAIACIPSHAAYFSAYEWGKEAFGANAAGHQPLAAAASGALATLLHDAVLTPMDVVKQRLQLGYYRNIVHCIRSMLRDEGAAAFVRSYPTTVAMNVPYAAVAVATNESLKKLLGSDPGFWTYLAAGAGAGAAAAAVTCPFDVLKTRIQTAPLLSQPRSSKSDGPPVSVVPASGGTGKGAPSTESAPRLHLQQMGKQPPWGSPFLRPQVATLYTASGRPSSLATARLIFRDEGVSAFFKGMGARVLVHAPSMAISWSTYELVKALLMYDDSRPPID